MYVTDNYRAALQLLWPHIRVQHVSLEAVLDVQRDLRRIRQELPALSDVDLECSGTKKLIFDPGRRKGDAMVHDLSEAMNALNVVVQDKDRGTPRLWFIACDSWVFIACISCADRDGTRIGVRLPSANQAPDFPSLFFIMLSVSLNSPEEFFTEAPPEPPMELLCATPPKRRVRKGRHGGVSAEQRSSREGQYEAEVGTGKGGGEVYENNDNESSKPTEAGLSVRVPNVWPILKQQRVQELADLCRRRMADASVPTLFRSGLAPEGRCAWYLNGSRQLLEDARTIRRLGYAFRIENEGVGVGGYENVLGDVLFDVLAIFGKRPEAFHDDFVKATDYLKFIYVYKARPLRRHFYYIGVDEHGDRARLAIWALPHFENIARLVNELHSQPSDFWRSDLVYLRHWMWNTWLPETHGEGRAARSTTSEKYVFNPFQFYWRKREPGKPRAAKSDPRETCEA
ncbi:hypothetical protein AAVH_32855 [Aphelenchoides avenae]|nr:hypothetical protein AAVH_32855 [Aphelenchus avenae]